MIDLYAWDTSNGRKVSILLEELGLDYCYHSININEGEQFTPSFLKLNPNGKIPAMTDRQGPDNKPLSLFESAAIMIYLADKSGNEYYPSDLKVRALINQWLMFQMGAVGPIWGQALHFYKYSPQQDSYAVERFLTEVHRLLNVMDQHLKDRKYFAENYSIADISLFPWIARSNWLDIDLLKYPNVNRWYKTVGSRAAVLRGMTVLSETENHHYKAANE